MESTLALKKKDLAVSTAIFLGWGRGIEFGADEAQTAYQKTRLKEYVDSAVRQFYWPALPGGESYEWSFMRPMATLTLALGATVVALPDDFGGVEGEVSVSTTSASSFATVPFVGVGQVYGKFALYPTAVGRPEMACVEPLKTTGLETGQRSRLKIYPTADAAYTVRFQYYLLPDCLTDSYPYAYGGAAHAETLLEACKAAAEAGEDDTMGLHRQLFEQRLIASVNQDKKLKPQQMRYNGDRSDWMEVRRWRGEGRDPNPVTFDGVSYP